MKLLIIPTLFALAGCLPDDGEAWRMYRSSPGDPHTSYHVASFDSSYGEDYNESNCKIFAERTENTPGVTVRYWCVYGVKP